MFIFQNKGRINDVKPIRARDNCSRALIGALKIIDIFVLLEKKDALTKEFEIVIAFLTPSEEEKSGKAKKEEEKHFFPLHRNSPRERKRHLREREILLLPGIQSVRSRQYLLMTIVTRESLLKNDPVFHLHIPPPLFLASGGGKKTISRKVSVAKYAN